DGEAMLAFIIGRQPLPQLRQSLGIGVALRLRQGALHCRDDARRRRRARLAYFQVADAAPLPFQRLGTLEDVHGKEGHQAVGRIRIHGGSGVSLGTSPKRRPSQQQLMARQTGRRQAAARLGPGLLEQPDDSTEPFMNRLPIVLAAVAGILAGALGFSLLNQPKPETDAVAVRAIVEQVLAEQPAPEAPQVAALDPAVLNPMIEDYLMSDPKLLQRLSVALEDTLRVEEQERTQVAMAEFRDAIFNAP